MSTRKLTASRTMNTAIILIALLVPSHLYATSEAEMPKGLWQAFSEARHTIEATEGDDAFLYRAQSPGNDLVFRFSEHGLTVKPSVPGRDWSLTMRLAAFGEEGAMTSPPAAEVAVEGRRIEYRRGGLTEWYVNDPGGLEQGFTIEKPEGYDGSESYVLSLDLDGGLRPTLKGNRCGVSFATPAGGQAFNYNGLAAFDAEGAKLPAKLALADGRLEIRVEVGDSQWPITVDPVIGTETKLQGTHDDAAADDHFGYSVAVDGTTAVIGSPDDDDTGGSSGSAYVFEHFGGAWVFQAKLTASDAAAGDQFGFSVSVSGDTVVVGSPGDDDGGNGSGSAYVYVRSGTSWTQQQKLTAGGSAEGGAGFGCAVSVSGTTTLVGAYLEDGIGVNRGAAYVFFRSGTWSLQEKLTAADSADSDLFGASVSVAGDTALVGAPYDDDGGTDNGSAYVFLRSGSSWTQEQKLTAPDAANSDNFGFSVSVSADTALIGAPTDDDGGTDNGSAYVWVRSAGSWSLEQKLTAPDAADADHFGWSVSVSADTALIGAPSDDDGGDGSGSAYAFTRSVTTWTQEAKLTASDAAAGDAFGWFVSVSGDTALVGAEHDDDGGADSGSANAFVRSGAAWSEHAKLEAVVTVADDHVGYSVSVSGDTVIVGAPDDDNGAFSTGAAHVFFRSGTSWSRQAKLTASDRAAYDFFGSSVAVDGSTAVIGAYYADGGEANSGAAYVFVRSGTTWSQAAKLTASDGAASNEFGYSVAVDGDTALVGAVWANSSAGAAYVYVRSGGVWTEQAKLSASDGAADDELGSGVSLSGETALVGAHRDDDGGANSGSAYVFIRSGMTWTQQSKLTASDADSNDYFGSSVSVLGDTALVGADFAAGATSTSGAAYVFTRSATTWTQQDKLQASDGEHADYFGESVSLLEDAAVIGADSDDDDGSGSGSSYIFVRGGTGWRESAKMTASDASADDNFGSGVAADGDTIVVGASGDDYGATASGSAYAYCFDCGFGAGIAQGRWSMIGLPCDPGGSNTVEDVLGDDLLPSRYLDYWVVYGRDHALNRYVRLNLTSPLEHGRGYWLYSTDQGMWDTSGTPTSYVQSGLCSSTTGCYEMTLTSPAAASTHLWNLIGHPGARGVTWSGVGVLVDGSLYTPSDAEIAGYVSKTIYKFSGSGYESYDDGTPGMEGSLESHEGIWVKVLGDSSGHTVKLLIPDKIVAGGPPGPPGMLAGNGDSFWQSDPVTTEKKPPTRVDEWYVRVIAESPAEGLYDTRNVLGQLLGSSDGYDMRDLPEMAPFSTPYLTIVFPHDDWGDHAGDYASDYHPPGWKEADEWVFQVRTDSPWRDVRLGWESVRMLASIVVHDNGRREWTTHTDRSGESLMAKMWLEDLDTGEMIKVAEDGVPTDYWFNMNGQTVRTFRWILKGKGGNEPPAGEAGYRDLVTGSADTLGLPPSSMDHPPRPGYDG